MSKMPEVFDTFDQLKAELNRSETVVTYATADVAAWLVDKKYEEKLRLGEAVKITKWGGEVSVVPVKWDRNPNTSQWGWLEVASPFNRQFDSSEEIGK